MFAEGDAAKAATEAGADHVGAQDLADRVSEGWTDFDVAIATPDLMGPVVSKLGRILGPQGKMPNPKVGTVTNDVAKAVGEAKAGKVEYRTDRQAVVHLTIGKASFDERALLENYAAVDRRDRSRQAGRRQGPLPALDHPGDHDGPRHPRGPGPHPGGRDPGAGRRPATAQRRRRPDGGAERRRSAEAAEARVRPPAIGYHRALQPVPAEDRRRGRSRAARKTGAGEVRSMPEPACARALSFGGEAKADRDEDEEGRQGSPGRRDRRSPRRRGGDLRRRLPGHHGPAGGRAARQAGRGRRHLPRGQEPAREAGHRAGRHRRARPAVRGPDRARLRQGRRGGGGEGDLDLRPPARHPRVQGRADGRGAARPRPVQGDRPPARRSTCCTASWPASWPARSPGSPAASARCSPASPSPSARSRSRAWWAARRRRRQEPARRREHEEPAGGARRERGARRGAEPREEAEPPSEEPGGGRADDEPQAEEEPAERRPRSRETSDEAANDEADPRGIRSRGEDSEGGLEEDE